LEDSYRKQAPARRGIKSISRKKKCGPEKCYKESFRRGKRGGVLKGKSAKRRVVGRRGGLWEVQGKGLGDALQKGRGVGGRGSGGKESAPTRGKKLLVMSTKGRRYKGIARLSGGSRIAATELTRLGGKTVG